MNLLAVVALTDPEHTPIIDLSWLKARHIQRCQVELWDLKVVDAQANTIGKNAMYIYTHTRHMVWFSVTNASFTMQSYGAKRNLLFYKTIHWLKECDVVLLNV